MKYLTKEFRDADTMNEWFSKNDIELIDIKMAGTQFNIYYLVIYMQNKE